jgi:hypothetical protein
MTDAADADLADVERYERLRSHALSGGPACFRLGLALLERRGVAAWARAWRDTPAARDARPSAAPVAEPPAASRELVGALASMALARTAAVG